MLYWKEFNRRPNVQHCSDEEKRRRFLLEQEEAETLMRMQAFNNHVSSGVQSVISDEEIDGDYFITSDGYTLITNEGDILLI